MKGLQHNLSCSYRWSQIFESCKIPREETVLKARAVDDDKVTPSFAPAPIKDVMAVIGEKKPEVRLPSPRLLVMANHVAC